MPLVVRQALAARLTSLPELQLLLDDVSLLGGVPVRFWSAVSASAEAGQNVEPEPVGLCERLARESGACRMCASFRQKLRERAATEPAEASCDAGLIELLVPVQVGGVLAGHFVMSGLREGRETPAACNRARHLLSRFGVSWSAEEISRLRAGAPWCDQPRREALARILHTGARRIGIIMTEHLSTVPAGVPALVEHAYRIVHAEHALPLRVPILARRLGVSAAHLSRIFHQSTGLRLVDYLARYRAGRARIMLGEDLERPVNEVARLCGFASISQFNRVFKTTFGVSPRSFRARADNSLPSH